MDDSVKEQIENKLTGFDIHWMEDESSLLDFYVKVGDGEQLNFRFVNLQRDELEKSKTYGRYGYHTGFYRWFDKEDMDAIRKSETSPVIFIFEVLDKDELYYVPVPKQYQYDDNSAPIIINGEMAVPKLDQFPEILNGREVIDFLDSRFERSIPSRIANRLLKLLGVNTDEMIPGVSQNEEEAR